MLRVLKIGAKLEIPPEKQNKLQMFPMNKTVLDQRAGCPAIYCR
jgi:hypothetical protein